MSLARFVDRVVARVRELPVDVTRLPEDAVAGSLYSGAAGVAFFLHEAARLRGDDALFDRARQWSETASAWAARATPSDWGGLGRGFLIGETGPAYVDALLSARRGEVARVLAAVSRIERVSDRFDDLPAGFRAMEIVGGAGGVVCATRDLDARLPRVAELDAARSMLARVRDRLVTMIAATHAAPLRPGPDDLLGMGHGIAGELWTLVTVLGADHAIVRARVDELAALREEDEEGLVYWLPSRASRDHFLLGTWCNGMPGQALLWSEVARQTGREAPKQLAAAAAKSAELLASRNFTLCCGLTGGSLALQRHADASAHARLGRRAYAWLVRACELAEAEGDASLLGLWRGKLGVALVAMRRLHGERAFPCLEPLPSRSRVTAGKTARAAGSPPASR